MPVLAFASDFQTPAMAVTELLDRQAESENIIVVDVRDSGEYKSVHVPGAINIPHKKLERKLDKLRDAEQILLDNHIEHAFHLEGGLMAWRQHDHKLKTGWGP